MPLLSFPAEEKYATAVGFDLVNGQSNDPIREDRLV